MITIVMDTSNQYLACGIYQDGQLIDSYQKIGTKRQSEDAIPVLYDLTNKHDIDLLKVDEMIITKGPGSYTGEGKKIAIIDARSKKVFACVYDDNKPLTEEKMYTFAELEELQKNYPDYTLVGEVRVLGLDNVEVDLVKAMYELGHKEAPLDNVDLLVPTYIKDVEAKKKCY